MRKFIIMVNQQAEAIKLLEETVEALEERLEALEIKSNRKPGRPPKTLEKDAECLT